ncbi:MAG: methyltransferase [Candidatus Hodarchaeales archaeon]
MLVESTILACFLVLVIRMIDRELLIKIFFPIEIPIPFPYYFIGAVLIIIGFIFVVWANYILLYVTKIGLIDREPFHVPTSLAQTGPYKYSRNPIYFGVIIIIFGGFILVRSLTFLIVDVFLMELLIIENELIIIENETGNIVH